jgi:chromosome segregation ATPase
MNGDFGTKDDHPSNKASAAPMSTTSQRNFSGPLAVEHPNMAAAPVSPVSPGTQWARPNPHSNPQSTPNNSKTSQYIDKITSENDRLRRELRAEKAAREDETTRIAAAKTKAEDSRAELQHLQVLAETNARAIERKDRKLEEMKALLDAEVHRRKVAEGRAEEALKMLGDTRSETQRQLATAYEMKQLADTQLETAREGFKRMTEGYEKKIRHISESMNELRKQRLEDSDKIKRQAVVSDQLHHEMSRTTRAEGPLVNLMEEYKKEHRTEMDHLVQEARKLKDTLPAKEREADRLVQQLEQTRDKMKWVMTQHQRQQDPRPLEQRPQQQRQPQQRQQGYK